MDGSSQPAAERPAQHTVNLTFNAPVWLYGLGRTSWLVVGVALVVLGFLHVVADAGTILMPLLVATVLAVVCAPLVSRLTRAGIPRGASTALFVVGVFGVAALLGYAIVVGVISEAKPVANHLESASSQIAAWVDEKGGDSSEVAQIEVKVRQTASRSVETLVRGTADGVRGLAGAMFFLALTLLSLIFILKDAPNIRGWCERHMGVPPPVARTITGGMVKSLRGYFVGMTILAAGTAAVIGLICWIVGVPLIATIVLVTFLAVYVPYIGAFGAALFTTLVAIATGSEGTIIVMIVAQLVIYALIHPMITPLIFGSTLDIHPLVALVATIGGGSIFGVLGLVLTAPIVAAVLHITEDLVEQRAVTSTDPSTAAEGGVPT